jgi:hypothetical protein
MDLRLLVSTAFTIGATVGFGGHALLQRGKGTKADDLVPAPATTLAAPGGAGASRPAQGPEAADIPFKEWPPRLAAVRDWAERGTLLQELVQAAVARGEWRKALDFLLGLPAGPQRSDAFHALVAELSKRNPRLALLEAVPLLQGIDQHNALTEAAINWTSGDPVAALDFAASEAGEPFRAALAELGAYELAAIDPTDAFRRIDAMREALGPEDYEHARTGILAGWAKLAAADAIDYALNHASADPEMLEVFVEAILASHASTDPAAALALVESTFDDPDTRAGASELVFEIWSQQDPAAAATAAARLSPGEGTDAIVVAIVREWRNYDEAAADAWLASFGGLSAEARESLELRPRLEADAISDSVP